MYQLSGCGYRGGITVFVLLLMHPCLYMYVAIDSYIEQAKRKKAIVTQQIKKNKIDACEQIMVKICY